MKESTEILVRERGRNRCEYCQLQQDSSPLAVLHVEYVIPIEHGGPDDTDNTDNLALACIDCNLDKGPNLTGIDPKTSEITVLYHPRQNSWDEHFVWAGIYIVGKTAVGRTTVRVLEMNSEEQLILRCS